MTTADKDSRNLQVDGEKNGLGSASESGATSRGEEKDALRAPNIPRTLSGGSLKSKLAMLSVPQLSVPNPVANVE